VQFPCHFNGFAQAHTKPTPSRLIVLCLLFGCISIRADTLPRVASINLCADQLVLLLAEPEQILSLSNLSHDSAGSYLYEQARQYPVSKGESESILALLPNLILAGQYTTRHTLKLLVELGFRVETIPIAIDFEQLYQYITYVADWLGHPEKGIALVARLRQRLVQQKKRLAKQSAINPTAAYYDANGYTVGRKTLRGLALELSGWNNVPADWGIEHYGVFPLESMVVLAPDAIVYSPLQ